MAGSCWLEFQRGAPGLENALLVEHWTCYRSLEGPDATHRLVLLVRGPRYSPPKDLIPKHQVCLIQHHKTILFDCTLHLAPALVEVSGPHPSNVTRNTVHGSNSLPVDVIASRLYSLVLAPMCFCIIFAEDEFEDLDDIVHILGQLGILFEVPETPNPSNGTGRKDKSAG